MTHLHNPDLAAKDRALTFFHGRWFAKQNAQQVIRRASGALSHCLSRTLSVALMLSLLVSSTPAAPQTIVGVATEWQVTLGFWYRSSEIPARFKRIVSGQDLGPKMQETQESRDATVSLIKIFPGDVNIKVDQKVQFAALAYDGNEAPVAGVQFAWEAVEQAHGKAAPISETGEFEAFNPGTFTISAKGAGQKAQVTITVADSAWRLDRNSVPVMRPEKVSSRDLPTNFISQDKEGASREGSAVALRAASAKGKTTRRAHGLTRASAAPPLPADGWDGTNYTSADDPGNTVGDPPGAPLDEGAGSGNFQLTAPVLGLPGRGVDVSLGLFYNSRVWNKSGTAINFDIDRDWPAPGWSLGFGKFVNVGFGGAMLIDADGTRHPFIGSFSTDFAYFSAHTVDGSFIDYSGFFNPGTGALERAWARFPNGTEITYLCQGPGGLFPTSVRDASGNFITITYVANTAPRIQTITDTLNRVIQFHYNVDGLLTAITGPGLNGGTRTLVRFDYRQISLSYSFSGLTAVVRDPNPFVLEAIYYPGTSTGYWFGDSDSYSSYGMLAKVVEQRGMSFSGAPLTEMGTVGQGAMTRQDVYSYPLTPASAGGSNLTDAPTYNSCTETWTTDGTNTDSATTSYEVHQESSPRTVTVTLPNGTKNTQHSYKAPGAFNDGLVFYDETRDANNNLLLSSRAEWEQGAYESPRPKSISTTNELLQTRGAEFSYGPNYNQVIEARSYDFGYIYGGANSLLTRTVTQYQNSFSYTNNHVFSLPLKVEGFDAANNRVSLLEYEYDGQTPSAVPSTSIPGYNHQYNAHAPQHWIPTYCFPTGCGPGGCSGQTCVEGHFESSYLPATAFRGNVTKVTTYANVTSGAASNPVVETRAYDVTGNLVTASSSCCEQTSFQYTAATWYAYPESQTRGSATDALAQVKTSATYDFNTGLVLSGTDANGRTSQSSYFAETLRPQTNTLPTGAHTDYAYDDTSLSVTTSTYLGGHPTDSGLAHQSVNYLNGHGQVRRQQALGAGGVWDFVSVTYDNLGRVWKQSRPYRNGETPQWTTVTYDALGRANRVTAPDESVNETYFNGKDFDTTDSYSPVRPNVVSQTAAGETTLVRDAWGRERWGRTDAQGRLVDVVEPNPAGNGSVATGGLLTTYSYNTRGNLTATNQGVQTRSFKYDSLGRLIAQKLAETNATLNDAGTYVGTGTWSDVFTYDDRSNLISRIDARGVKTVYSYNSDPLNRLQSVSWDRSGFGDTANPILPAAPVSYQYRTKSSGAQLRDITQLVSITTTDVSTESYSFDSQDRMESKTLTLTTRSSYPFVTNYVYDELDRVTDVRYPAEYGNGSQPRKVVHQDYDVSSRLSSLTMDGQSHASQIEYNAASQTTQLKVGVNGSNQITENYGYQPETGLLDNQTIVRGGATTLLNLGYEYTNANGRRTGQLTKILNNLNHNKDRSYSYDALGRLIQAQGGPSGSLWTQTYVYDRYGNRTSVSASGNSASVKPSAASTDLLAASKPRAEKTGSSASAAQSTLDSELTKAPPNPKVVIPTEQLAAATNVELPESLRTDAPRSISDSSFNLSSPAAPIKPATVQGGPPAFTDDPLVPGVSVIKAVHITELRTAVNQARARAGLPAASWAQGVVPGVPVNAAHIVELRAQLAEARIALGLSSGNYTDPALNVGTTIKAVHVQELRQRVTEVFGGISGCPPGQNLTTDQFVRNFYQGVLNRQPNAAELQSWTEQLRQAYWQGQSPHLAKAQYLGRQLFKSQEYINRNRNDSEYVYDLYKGYLQREPDQAGWNFWTGEVIAHGRDTGLDAFSYSPEFEAKVGSVCPGPPTGSSPIPLDGIANLSYDAATNRITTAGFQYDAAGNQTRTVRVDGSAQRFQYDAANRLVIIRDDSGYTLATYSYGDDNQRLTTEEGGLRTYYEAAGGTVLAEYTESVGATTPAWSRSYIFLGPRLLSTLKPNGSGGEAIQYHHPDRLGTRLITNAQDTSYFEQTALPFGTALNAESTGATNRRFTSYDRSAQTGLDYAVNRHYDSQQGRFTQVDPIGMSSTSLESPQTLNLYAYCANDPINHADPSGLGFFSFLKKIFNKIVHALKAALAAFVVAFVSSGGDFRAARRAGVEAFVSDLGFRTRTWNTPQWNPNAVPILGTGVGALNRYIIWNFQDPGQDVDIIRSWIWEPGSKILAIMNRIRKALCKAVPTGRVIGVQATGGILGGPTGGVELVSNYRSGQVSGFAFGGGQVGWNGVASGNVSGGFVWGLNDSNSNYSEGFSGGNISGRLGISAQSSSGGLTSKGARDLIPNPRAVTSVSLTAGQNLLQTPTWGATVTHYSPPLQMGKWWVQASNGINPIDTGLFAANQACR